MAAFSLGDQPLLDLVRSEFSGAAEAEAEERAVSFDEHHLYLNQQRPIYNAVGYNHSLSLSDHFLMEFIPEMNGLSGFDYYAEMSSQPNSVLAQAGDVWGGVGHTQRADSLENTNFDMPSLGRKLLLDSPYAVMINDEKPQALYCTNQFGEKLSSSGSDYTSSYQVLRNGKVDAPCKAKKRNGHDVLVQNSRQTHKVKGLGNKCKSLKRANACEELENGSDLKIDLYKESRGESPAKVVKKEEKAESPKGFIHVRARRGEATDSHSLAERVRREKIRERMKRLQDLVPGCSKVTGKAQLLDEIINYVQSLQSQVELLSVKLDFVLRYCNNSHVQVDGNPSQKQIEEVLSIQGNTILPVAAYDTAINHVEEVEITGAPNGWSILSMILNE